MPRKKMKNWRIEFKPASSQIIEISTKGNKLPAEFCWLVPWFDKGWGGGCSRDFLWEPAGADKALQPAENKIINWLGFNGVHYLWVQTPRWEEIYSLLVISNLSPAAWNNKPGQCEDSQWGAGPEWHLCAVERSHSGWRLTAGLKSVTRLRVTN